MCIAAVEDPTAAWHLRTATENLVGRGQQRFWDGEAERFGSLEVDDEFEFRRLLHREISWFLAFQNAPSINPALVEQIAAIGAIAHQAAGQDELSELEDRRQRVPRRQRREFFHSLVEEGTGVDQDRTNALL